MPTVLRSRGLRFVIFVDDHEPAHVHVFGEGESKIDIGTAELVWAVGMKRSEIQIAIRVVDQNRRLLLSKWKNIHG